MRSDWEKLDIAERRGEVRISGKKAEGISVLIADSSLSPGWDQERRWEGKISNVSAGGIEACLEKSFPHAVDAQVNVSIRFPGQQDWISIPGVVRHRHNVDDGSLVGIQFLWKSRSVADLDVEYEFCHQILLCERKKV